MHFYFEEESSGPDFRMVRGHRVWAGRPTKELQKVEVPEYASDEPVVYAIELSPDETMEGQSARMKSGLVITAEPEKYGDPDVRLAAGRHVAARLTWEEWTLVT